MIKLIRENNKIIEIDYMQAFKIAKEKNMSLITIKKEENLYKIMDYKKYIYIKKKNFKANKNVTKEIKFRINISDNDMKIKVKKINELRKKKMMIKISIFLKGRENLKKNVIDNFLEVLKKKLNINFLSIKRINNIIFFLVK
ncbi:hypothetical protein ACWNYO_00475 [Candidatus Vidania fulgoroideorum]